MYFFFLQQEKIWKPFIRKLFHALNQFNFMGWELY